MVLPTRRYSAAAPGLISQSPIMSPIMTTNGASPSTTTVSCSNSRCWNRHRRDFPGIPCCAKGRTIGLLSIILILGQSRATTTKKLNNCLEIPASSAIGQKLPLPSTTRNAFSRFRKISAALTPTCGALWTGCPK